MERRAFGAAAELFATRSLAAAPLQTHALCADPPRGGSPKTQKNLRNGALARGSGAVGVVRRAHVAAIASAAPVHQVHSASARSAQPPLQGSVESRMLCADPWLVRSPKTQDISEAED